MTVAVALIGGGNTADGRQSFGSCCRPSATDIDLSRSGDHQLKYSTSRKIEDLQNLVFALDHAFLSPKDIR